MVSNDELVEYAEAQRLIMDGMDAIRPGDGCGPQLGRLPSLKAESEPMEEMVTDTWLSIACSGLSAEVGDALGLPLFMQVDSSRRSA